MFAGHNGCVSACEFSKDGKHVGTCMMYLYMYICVQFTNICVYMNFYY